MLLLIPIVFLAIVLFYLISMTMKTKKGCRRRKRTQKECFVEYNEPTAQGQLLVSDTNNNLSTFSVGTGKTLISDGAGNITTINTGLFNNTITANGGLTGSTGTFSGQLRANGGLTGTTATLSGNLSVGGKSVAKIPTTNAEAQNGITEISSLEGSWGSYPANWAMCPAGSYVCGFMSKVEAAQTGTADDTAMNGVKLRCCKFLV